MSRKEALVIVLDLAIQSTLDDRQCDGDHALEEEMKRQVRAVEIVQTMLGDL